MVGHISYRKRFYVPSNVFLFLQWVMSLHCHVVHEVNGMRRCNDYVMVLSYVQKLLIGYKCFLQVSSWWKEKEKKEVEDEKKLLSIYIYTCQILQSYCSATVHTLTFFSWILFVSLFHGYSVFSFSWILFVLFFVFFPFFFFCSGHRWFYWLYLFLCIWWHPNGSFSWNVVLCCFYVHSIHPWFITC